VLPTTPCSAHLGDGFTRRDIHTFKTFLCTPCILCIIVTVSSCVEFIRACADGDIKSASKTLGATLLTTDDVTNFVNSRNPYDHYSLLYRLLFMFA